MNHRVVITGMGCVSGVGVGSEQSWKRVARGDGAIRENAREVWKGEPDLAISGPMAVIDRDALAPCLEGKDLRRLGRLDPLSTFALVAEIEAVEQAGLAGHPSLHDRCAILLGCGSGGNATYDAAFERLYARKVTRVHPQTSASSMISAPPVLNYLGPDPGCVLPLALDPVPVDHKVLVSNSFAFGGLNVVLFGKVRG
jgi:nodulation protein E